MAQAIKHFSGSAIGTNYTTTVYTCPANTIAMVVPSMAITNYNGTRSLTLAWNRSSAVTTLGYGNFRFDVKSYQSFSIVANNKYDIEVGTPSTSGSAVFFSPDGDSNEQLSDGSDGLYVTGSGSTATAYLTGAVTSQLWGDTGAYRSFKVGSWVMSPGHVLSFKPEDPYMRVRYSFLILEETAG